MSVATLTLTTTDLDPSPGVFSFDTFLTPDGWAAYIAQHVQEELTTPGVNGKRWRTVFDQAPQLQARCVSAQADYATAVATAARLRETVGRYANIVLTTGALAIKLKVYIAAAPSTALPGPVVVAGSGATASGVLCEFTFEVIEGSGAL